MRAVTLPLLFAAFAVAAALPQAYDPRMKTFGHAVKNGQLPAGATVTAFEHVCGAPPCVVTQIHVPSVYPPGGEPWRWEEAVVTLEMDGRVAELTLLELVLEGRTGASGETDNNGGPWGTQYFGKTAKSGGIYSTIRIPFQRTFKISIRASPAAKGTSVYWMIVRGVEAYHVTVGGVALPADARLIVDRFGPRAVGNLQFIEMANFTAGTDGVLFATMFSAESPDYTYLEACVRLVDTAGDVTFLSSGAEDYFLSASYFDEGMFKTEEAGITFYDGHGSVSAYKVHDRDLVFTKGGGALRFRVGESTGGCGSMEQCPQLYCTPEERARAGAAKPPRFDRVGVSANLTYTTLVLRYEWDHQDVPAAAAAATAAAATDDTALTHALFTAVHHAYLSPDDAARAVAAPADARARMTAALVACGARCFDSPDSKPAATAAAMIAALARL